jgi:hypothetical protein
MNEGNLSSYFVHTIGTDININIEYINSKYIITLLKNNTFIEFTEVKNLELFTSGSNENRICNLVNIIFVSGYYFLIAFMFSIYALGFLYFFYEDLSMNLIILLICLSVLIIILSIVIFITILHTEIDSWEKYFIKLDEKYRITKDDYQTFINFKDTMNNSRKEMKYDILNKIL